MFKKVLTLSTILVLLSSCGEHAEKVEPLKRGDKNLSCSEILLEINEADFYKKQATEKKQLGVKSIVMPLGYIDTYMSADDAIQAADSRVNYLNKIYDIKGCAPADEAVDTDNKTQNRVNNNIQNSVRQPQGSPPPVTYQNQYQQPQPGYGYPSR